MIRFLILALLAYVFYRTLKKLVSGGSGPGHGQRKTSGGAVDDVLIQDPICQTYFARRDGVHLHHKGRDLYFCSNQCRERYLLDQTPPNDRADGA